jgi:TRAP-type C4-dicarboxylate transport system substrate-binding protein
MFLTYKIDETVDYLMNFPIYSGGYFTIINEDLYNSLPADLQLDLKEAFDWVRYSISDMVQSQLSDNLDQLSQNGVEVYSISDEFSNELKEQSSYTIDDYITKMNGLGYDGQAIINCVEGVKDRCESGIN